MKPEKKTKKKKRDESRKCTSPIGVFFSAVLFNHRPSTDTCLFHQQRGPSRLNQYQSSLVDSTKPLVFVGKFHTYVSDGINHWFTKSNTSFQIIELNTSFLDQFRYCLFIFSRVFSGSTWKLSIPDELWWKDFLQPCCTNFPCEPIIFH